MDPSDNENLHSNSNFFVFCFLIFNFIYLTIIKRELYLFHLFRDTSSSNQNKQKPQLSYVLVSKGGSDIFKAITCRGDCLQRNQQQIEHNRKRNMK
uniref:Uncharacterized protein n=1 Tax=Octopus bimaculoides TaxID=37653 RepID=A0A0L8GR23_OCTBM